MADRYASVHASAGVFMAYARIFRCRHNALLKPAQRPAYLLTSLLLTIKKFLARLKGIVGLIYH